MPSGVVVEYSSKFLPASTELPAGPCMASPKKAAAYGVVCWTSQDVLKEAYTAAQETEKFVNRNLD